MVAARVGIVTSSREGVLRRQDGLVPAAPEELAEQLRRLLQLGLLLLAAYPPAFLA